MTSFEIQNISKSFNDSVVLDGVCLNVKKGEVISIIGPSGAGKTTLLRLIAGYEKPDEGVIKFDENTNIGFVFQDFNLWPHMNVLENIIEAPMRVKKISKENAVKDAKEILRKVGLEAKAKANPNQLSGGEKQRVAIARALAMYPKILLLDEVTSNLDQETVGEINKIIKGLASQGYTILLSSHDYFFIKEVADRVIFLEDGKIVEEGPSTQILTNPQQERTKRFLERVIKHQNEVLLPK